MHIIQIHTGITLRDRKTHDIHEQTHISHARIYTDTQQIHEETNTSHTPVHTNTTYTPIYIDTGT